MLPNHRIQGERSQPGLSAECGLQAPAGVDTGHADPGQGPDVSGKPTAVTSSVPYL
jgi:hypothetical protein